MNRFPSARLLLALLYLGAIFVIGGLMYQRFAAFSGFLPVAKGRTERTVVRPSEKGVLFIGMQRNMPLDVISFDHPEVARRLLDDKRAYDAFPLPFRLRLKDIEVLEERAPRDLLRVTRPGGRKEIAVRAGERVRVGGRDWPVTIRPWAGLLRHASGHPMACVSLRQREGAWLERLSVGTDAWLCVEAGVALRLRWHATEAAAREAHEKGLEGPETGNRWGVRDGRAVLWSNSFTPGTGFTLSDGAQVALKESITEPPRITAVFARGDKIEELVADANARTPEARLLYESPAAFELAVVLDGWREGKVLVSAYNKGARCGAACLDENANQPGPPLKGDQGGCSTVAEFPGFPSAIRLEQAMANALPVSDSGAPVWEVVLENGGDRITLREGESKRVDDVTLQYRRAPTPPLVRYTFETIRKGEQANEEFNLAPGESHRVGDWVFQQAADSPFAGEVAVLEAHRTMGGPVAMAGMAMFVIGAFGLVLARFWRPRRGAEVVLSDGAEWEPPPRASQ